MDFLSVFFLSIGLAMDAFAVSICKGLALGRTGLKQSAIVGLWFGGFQALMPVIGYFLGSTFAGFITNVAPWIAFALLFLIGANMIREALSRKKEEATNALGFKTMLLMAIATSIDALAVGLSFAFIPVEMFTSCSEIFNMFMAVTIIGTVTFIISGIGVKIGSVFGSRFEKKAQLAGGIILILLGIKIILEHFNIISF